MATIRERNGHYSVIYNYKDAGGNRKQKWETYNTLAEAKRRKAEIEYKHEQGTLVVPRCTYLKQLLEEYVKLYGKDKWALSSYDRNVAQINNYIIPIIGDMRLIDLNTRTLEVYYQQLLKTPAVSNPFSGKPKNEFVSTSTIRDIHKILRNCFEQAVKWELMEKNPAIHATVPKHKGEKREIWTAQTLLYAMDVCEEPSLKIAMNLAFAGSLRMGELLALTWDCVDISKEAIEENRAYIFINKELQRVSKKAAESLEGKDIMLVFPGQSKTNRTIRVLKSPKTESSVRRVFLPRSVAEMLVSWKAEQDETKEILGDEYQDYNLVLCTTYGTPDSGAHIRKMLDKLIKKYDLPPIVFHSLRHTSVTYKLKLNGGDIKAVQGDSGHSQVSMVTDVYSHIIDEDRKKNAELFEEAFYGRKNLDPHMHEHLGQRETALSASYPEDLSRTSGTRSSRFSPQEIHEQAAGGRNMVEVPEGMDPELIEKILGNPETAALLAALAKSMQK